MTMRSAAAALLLCLVLTALLGWFDQTCHAAGDMDPDRMQRTGIEGVFQGGAAWDAGRAANKWQTALGLGAFVVMFIVVKWL